jgi:hypothetical protein
MAKLSGERANDPVCLKRRAGVVGPTRTGREPVRKPRREPRRRSCGCQHVTVSRLDLRCPSGCEDGRFEALNAPLIVDGTGRYVEHDASQATFVCVRCQAVAVDLAGAAREMRAGERIAPMTLTCPACGLELLPPEDEPLTELLECPACETRFSFEEGIDRLHGGGGAPPWAEAPPPG